MKTERLSVALLLLVFAGLLGWALFSGGKDRAARRTLMARTPTPDPRGVDASGRTPTENQAIAEALRAMPREAVPVRLAEDSDAADSDARKDLENLYADYHPFFVRGDLDGDGRLDFVQGFVERGRGTAWFHVAVFFGTPDGKFARPIWVEKAISLSDGDLAVERSLVVVTPDLSVDQARRWRFEPMSRRFVDADAVPSADTPAEDEGDDAASDQRA